MNYIKKILSGWCAAGFAGTAAGVVGIAGIVGTVGVISAFTVASALPAYANSVLDGQMVFSAGHASLQHWLLPVSPEHPDDNKPTAARIALGKQLFFDPRLSGDSNMSCASCHHPSLGWGDALPTGRGAKSETLARATPTVINTGYNPIQMWDGRKKTLEEQALGPITAKQEMNMDLTVLLDFLKANKGYQKAFADAYEDQPLTPELVAKAIASYERTVISRNSHFDRWVQGDSGAMTAQQIRGFKLFVDPAKGNCSVCHSAPNFTDNGFHNLGLASFGDAKPDLGRYTEKPIRMMKGAFKTPTLREITRTAPYFHDGSASTLEAVMTHYIVGGVVKTNVSPNLKALTLTAQESADIVAFLQALESPFVEVALPQLPLH